MFGLAEKAYMHICCDESQKPDLVLNLNSDKDSWTGSDC